MNTLDQLLAALEFFSVGEFENEVLDDEVRQAADMLYNQRRYGRETLDQGSLAVIYADHVTAQQQAEIARLNARVAELEKDSFKNGMKDLLLQAMGSTSEMPMYPVELETEDGSFIKAVIAIKIQAVGVAK